MGQFRKAALLAASCFAISGTASADCGGNGTYCSMSAYEGGSTYSHSSHSTPSYSSSSYDAGETIVSGSTYSSAPVSYSSSSSSYTSSYSAPSNRYVGVASDAYADATYGSGSISQAYEDTSYSTSSSNYVPFSGGSMTTTGTISGLSIPGMGANEELCPVDCAKPVGSIGSGRVLGCYAVCKPAPKPVTYTTYTQVVRPVIYVRYPVPYAVPYMVPGAMHASRYGDHAHRGGYAPNCSYDYGYHGHAGYGGYGCR